MSDLVLHLKKEWFDKIKSGEKKEEYREFTPYWVQRIHNRNYDRIVLLRGYPSRRDEMNCMIFPWRRYTIKEIGHWERQEMIKVFALPLEASLMNQQPQHPFLHQGKTHWECPAGFNCDTCANFSGCSSIPPCARFRPAPAPCPYNASDDMCLECKKHEQRIADEAARKAREEDAAILNWFGLPAPAKSLLNDTERERIIEDMMSVTEPVSTQQQAGEP